jgi:hypothetical protein
VSEHFLGKTRMSQSSSEMAVLHCRCFDDIARHYDIAYDA